MNTRIVPSRSPAPRARGHSLALFAIGMIDHLHVAGARVVSRMERVMLQGRTFDEMLEEVHGRAERNLPDRVVPTASFKMTPEGHLSLDGVRYRLNSWTERQLGSLLGVRWKTWFSGSITGDERADEINRRLSRMTGKTKLRAMVDLTPEADGVARAFLSESFTPIDDVRVFDAMSKTLASMLASFRFTRFEATDSTTHYTAVHVDARNIGGDELHPGWHFRNSEVGGGAVSVDDLWYRVICTNGLLLEVGAKRLLYRTHRPMEDDLLAAALVLAMTRLPDRWNEAERLFERAQKAAVSNPDEEVEEALDAPEIPRKLVEEAQRVSLSAGDRTRYGVVQAITEVAHTKNADPNVRFAMERAAGRYLAAA
jgi:hypothetical protein